MGFSVFSHSTPLFTQPFAMTQPTPSQSALPQFQEPQEYDARIRDQWERAPYPNIPLEQTPAGKADILSKFSLVLANYVRHQQVVETQGKVILDAGCGSGYKALALAIANPGAKVIGVDLSPESIALSQSRLKHHGFDNCEFYAHSINELAQLGYTYDYINCDDVLYLLEDPIQGLTAMRSVLNPQGIIRANFHSTFQRENFFRAQKLCTLLGLMDATPDIQQLETLRALMRSLRPQVPLKNSAWHDGFETDDERLIVNYLMLGDKGWTVPEFFAALDQAKLEFIRMVNWREWDVTQLFESWDDLPVELVFGISEMTPRDLHYLFDILNPTNRLLDLWCGHPNEVTRPYSAIEDWSDADWESATIHLNPYLVTESFKTDLYRCIQTLQPFNLTQHLKTTNEVLTVASTMAINFVRLLQSPQSLESLLQTWLQVYPLDAVTLDPTQPDQIKTLIKEFLTAMERFGYLYLTQSA
jgi:2-polyprenyl-3-methyl-5-hydroxy-6-metoxy-1,4-benzoquinol methylase